MEDRCQVDLDEIGDLKVAYSKLKALYKLLDERPVYYEEENLVKQEKEDWYWADILDEHFFDYSMQYFLTTPLSVDGEWKFRSSAFSSSSHMCKDSKNFADATKDYALSVIEDLMYEIRNVFLNRNGFQL